MARPGLMRAMLWQVSVRVTPESEEAVAEWLTESLAQPAVTYTDARTGAMSVSAYLPSASDWSPLRRHQLMVGLRRLRATHPLVGQTRVSVRPLRRENWAESWKHHFPALEIGSQLLIKPSWIRRKAKPGQAVVVIDPGLSFGTGQHPTTRFCLEQLVAARTPGQSQSLLDVGTGSGLLAIAAAKMGYSLIEAWDFDREAVRIATRNARRNGVSDRLRICRADITQVSVESQRRFDVVCANLTADLLTQESQRLLERLKPSGTLILAGILKSQFAEVIDRYERAGLKLKHRRGEREWQSGAFRFMVVPPKARRGAHAARVLNPAARRIFVPPTSPTGTKTVRGTKFSAGRRKQQAGGLRSPARARGQVHP